MHHNAAAYVPLIVVEDANFLGHLVGQYCVEKVLLRAESVAGWHSSDCWRHRRCTLLQTKHNTGTAVCHCHDEQYTDGVKLLSHLSACGSVSIELNRNEQALLTLLAWTSESSKLSQNDEQVRSQVRVLVGSAFFR